MRLGKLQCHGPAGQIIEVSAYAEEGELMLQVTPDAFIICDTSLPKVKVPKSMQPGGGPGGTEEAFRVVAHVPRTWAVLPTWEISSANELVPVGTRLD